MKKLTIIMPFLNEGDEPLKTIESIYRTCDTDFIDIIAIDDCSTYNYSDFSLYPKVKIVRNAERIGVASCRHMAAKMATTPFILIIDGHMRFRNDNWYERITSSIEKEPETLFCTTCVALSPSQMDMSKAGKKYYGADLKLIDESQKSSIIAGQIIEPKWAKEKPFNEYEIACVLGANYAMSVEWFLKIGGLQGLCKWGGDEAFISLKTWLYGGKCKIIKDVEIGHMFRDNAPYETHLHHLHYNKIFICMTIFPDKLGYYLSNILPNVRENDVARRNIGENWESIQKAKNHYSKTFVKNIFEISDQLGLDIPTLN